MKLDMKAKCLLSCGLMLVFGAEVTQALPLTYGVTTDTHSDTTVTGVYQPLETKNVLAVASLSSDFSYGPVTEAADAAVFGSDASSVSCTVCKGLGVEPMAYAAAETVYFDNSAFNINPLAFAFATIEIRYRLALTDDAPTGDWQIAIPLFLDYKLEASQVDTADGNYTEALFYVVGPGGLNISKHANSGQSFSGKLTLNQAAFDEISIGVSAGVNARYDNIWNGTSTERHGVSGIAVADPFLYVDPAWEYARYVSVQQESILNPGEWVGVTRAWLQPAAVPEPTTWSLILMGIGLIGVTARTRRS